MSGTLTPWTDPGDYAGYQPTGHLGVIAVRRDSELLGRVNWDVACERLAEVAGIETIPNLADVPGFEGWSSDPDLAPPVYWWEVSHWAVGWVRYLMVRPDAPQAVLEAAQEIADDLSDYCILDEDRFSEEEYEGMQNYWASLSVRERAGYIKDSDDGVSIFASRRDWVPQNNGRLDEYIREGL